MEMRLIKNYIISDIVFGSWILAGIVLDEKYHVAHKHETLFTIPHMIIDTGLAALVIRFVWILVSLRRLGKPPERGILAFGIVAFVLGLVGDVALHYVFNVQDEWLFSRPTHLLILTGFVMFLVCFYFLPPKSDAP